MFAPLRRPARLHDSNPVRLFSCGTFPCMCCDAKNGSSRSRILARPTTGASLSQHPDATTDSLATFLLPRTRGVDPWASRENGQPTPDSRFGNIHVKLLNKSPVDSISRLGGVATYSNGGAAGAAWRGPEVALPARSGSPPPAPPARGLLLLETVAETAVALGQHCLTCPD